VSENPKVPYASTRRDRVGVPVVNALMRVLTTRAYRDALERMVSDAWEFKAAKHTEWGIRWGDGDLDASMTREQAEGEVRQALDYIAEQGCEWDAYEGAEVVCREVVEQVGEWRVP